MGLTSYVKYLAYLFGFIAIKEDLSNYFLIAAGVGYLLLCLIVGWFWIKFDFAEKQNEIQNQLNPFQKEVREKFK